MVEGVEATTAAELEEETCAPSNEQPGQLDKDLESAETSTSSGTHNATV